MGCNCNDANRFSEDSGERISDFTREDLDPLSGLRDGLNYFGTFTRLTRRGSDGYACEFKVGQIEMKNGQISERTTSYFLAKIHGQFLAVKNDHAIEISVPTQAPKIASMFGLTSISFHVQKHPNPDYVYLRETYHFSSGEISELVAPVKKRILQLSGDCCEIAKEFKCVHSKCCKAGVCVPCKYRCMMRLCCVCGDQMGVCEDWVEVGPCATLCVGFD